MILIKESSLSAARQYYPQDTLQVIPQVGRSIPTEFFEDLKELSPRALLVCDANLFKRLTGLKKAEQHLGDEYQWQGIPVFYGINPSQLIYNPQLEDRMRLAHHVYRERLKGITSPRRVITPRWQAWPSIGSLQGAEAYIKLLEAGVLAVDIETSSLNFYEAELISIAFSWSEEEGLACFFKPEEQDRDSLRKLFEELIERKTTLLFHNGSYDLKVLIHLLYCSGLGDSEGILKGIGTFFSTQIHDTRLLAYVALNSTVQQSYGLKDLCSDVYGAWGIENFTQKTKELLQYNVTDTCATYWLYKQYQKETQEVIYQHFQKLLPVLIQTEMTGMPLDMERVRTVNEQLLNQKEKIEEQILSYPEVLECEYQLKEQEAKTRNSRYKRKVITADDVSLRFNPNSNHHIACLLYQVLALPINSLTATGNPASSKSVLELFQEHHPVVKDLLQYKALQKIISAFMPHLLAAPPVGEGHRLFGNFLIGGTKSGRLSSSNPNLTQLPSGSSYGKLIKSCFISDREWLFCGADFNALEDRVNALLTEDPNKLKIYIEGYDSHCLRAYSYFKDQMPLIRQAAPNQRCFKRGNELFIQGDICDGQVVEAVYDQQSNQK